MPRALLQESPIFELPLRVWQEAPLHERFGLETKPQIINGAFIPALSIPPPVAEAGLGLRVSF